MEQALTKRDRDPGWLVRSPRRLQAAVFILVSAVSLLGVFGIENAEMRRRHSALERNASDMAAALRQLDTGHELYLRASAALIAARHTVTAQDFEDLQSQLNFDEYRQGSLGVGWAPRVPQGEMQRRQGAPNRLTSPNFQVYQSSQGQIAVPLSGTGRGDAFPVMFLTSLNNANAAVVGFDMYSEATRRAAMDRAAAINAPVATGLVQLVGDSGSAPKAGFLIYMPVFYRNVSARPDGAKIMVRGPSHGRLRGFVYMPFRASTLLAMASALSAGDKIRVAAYDGHVAPDRLMASLDRLADRGLRKPLDSGNAIVEQVNIANRPWQLVISAGRPVGLSRVSQIIILSGLMVAVLLVVLIRMTYQKINEERQLLEWKSSEAGIRNSLTRELNHRVKNTLATVLSIVTLTRRRETDLDSYVESLSGRIRALSATHDLLTSSDWASIELRSVILAELAPYLGAKEDHVQLEGPEIRLAPNDALTLGLAIHELATNAAKYGALSVLTGRIGIVWQKIDEQAVEIRWQESGGPPVKPPSKRGFGRELIEKILARELDSPVTLTFAAEGLQCVFRVPLRAPGAFVLRTAPGTPPQPF